MEIYAVATPWHNFQSLKKKYFLFFVALADGPILFHSAFYVSHVKDTCLCTLHTKIYSIYMNLTISSLHTLLISTTSITLKTACLSASHELEISGLVLYSHTLSQFGMSSVNIFSEKFFWIPILASLVDLIKYNKTHNIVKINLLVSHFKLITVNSL